MVRKPYHFYRVDCKEYLLLIQKCEAILARSFSARDEPDEYITEVLVVVSVGKSSLVMLVLPR